jgi:flavodoxin
MKIAIRYFTGTGNTARACAIVSETFSSAGWEVDVQELRPDRTSLTDLDDADLLLAAFPVLGFSPPASVSRWLGRLPKEKGKKAAVLAVVGATVVQNRYIPGWGADAPFSAARLLGRRGWEVVGIGEVSYPDNFTQATNPPTPEQCREIRERNDPETLAYALALEEAARTGNRPPMLSRSRAVRIPFALIAFLFRVPADPYSRGPSSPTTDATAAASAPGPVRPKPSGSGPAGRSGASAAFPATAASTSAPRDR